MISVPAIFRALDDSGRRKTRETYLPAPMRGDRYVVNTASLPKAPQPTHLHGALRVRTANPDSVEFASLLRATANAKQHLAGVERVNYCQGAGPMGP